MKKVCIIHRWDGSPNEPQLQWLRKELEQHGYEVVVPLMPDPTTPVIDAWIAKIGEIVLPDEETIFVGHSIGCQAIMRYLETQDEQLRIKGIVLLAPWMHLDQKILEEEGEEVLAIAKPWVEHPIDFKKVKKISPNIVAIFSDNDIFVPISEKDFFEEHLGTKTIVEHDKGNFSPTDNTVELPSTLESILNL